MKNTNMVLLTNEELKNVHGGMPIAVAAIIVGYICWGASFCYQLGKD